MTRTKFLSIAALGILPLCMADSPTEAQSLYNVSINTSGLRSTAGGLAFDFLAGDNATPNNTVTITQFITNGTLAGGSNTNQGTVSGDLPGTLTLQDSAFSESFRGETFGSSLSFTLTSTNQFAAPGAPDEFSFFLTDPTNTSTLVATSDPTGANALFVLDLDGSTGGALTVFTASTTGISYTVLPVQQSVPEPSILACVVACLMAGGVFVCSRPHRREPKSLFSRL